MSNASKNIFGIPTIRNDSNFNAQKSADLLHDAIGEKDKDSIIEILCCISNQQRQEVISKFKTLFGEDLCAKMRKALSGNFEELMLALMELPATYDAQQLHKAMAGLGTNESVLIEILITHSNRQIDELNKAYQQLYGHALEKDIVDDTSGPFQHLLVSLCNSSRDERQLTDQLKADQTAHVLFSEGEGKKGVNDAVFNQVMANENYSQLLLIFDEYEKVAGHSIETAIRKEFSGDDREGFLAVVESVRNRAAFFAKLLRNTTKGFGTRDSDLIRLIVTRAECDLAEIKEQYVRLFGTTLEKAIDEDCSGSYKEGLLAMISGN